jgi:outer membrane protein assembly factor BamB
VLQLNKELNVDPSLSETPVRLPRPYENKEWPQPGGNQAHAMYHLSAGTGAFKQIWSANIGSSADSANRLLAEPVIADGKVFTLDSESLVRVFDAETGKMIWENDLTPDTDDDDLFGGGIAVYEGKVFVTTPSPS